MRQGMSRDASWNAAARAYLDLYTRARNQPADRSQPLGQRQTGLGFERTGCHRAAF